MTCTDVLHGVDAYLDHELDARVAQDVRDHVATCAACRRRLIEREALARMIRSVPYASVPDRLRARVAQRARQSRIRHRVLTWAAAAVFVVAVVGTGAVLRVMALRGSAAADGVVSVHVRALMVGHLVDVRSTDQHTVKPWFLGKLDFSPRVVDLAPLGYTLVGGRIDDVDGRRVAALVYERRRHPITVVVSAESARGFPWRTVRTRRGFHVHHWTRDSLSFWAVSDLNEAELAEFVRAFQGP